MKSDFWAHGSFLFVHEPNLCLFTVKFHTLVHFDKTVFTKYFCTALVCAPLLTAAKAAQSRCRQTSRVRRV